MRYGLLFTRYTRPPLHRARARWHRAPRRASPSRAILTIHSNLTEEGGWIEGRDRSSYPAKLLTYLDEMLALNKEFKAWVEQQLQRPDGPHDLSCGLRDYINYADDLRKKYASAVSAAAAITTPVPADTAQHPKQPLKRTTGVRAEMVGVRAAVPPHDDIGLEQVWLDDVVELEPRTYLDEMLALNTEFKAWAEQQLQRPDGPHDLSCGLRDYINYADDLRKKYASAVTAAAAITAAVQDQVRLDDVVELEVLLTICAHLDSPKDLVRLACASSSFGRAVEWGSVVERRSVVEESARRRVSGYPIEQRRWVPRRVGDCWLGLMQEACLLRGPLVFQCSHGNIALAEGGAVATITGGDQWLEATSKVVMRSGRHYARFTAIQGEMRLGVIKPGARRPGQGTFYSTLSGRCYPGHYDWKGRWDVESHTITIELDLDAGTMSAVQGQERVGVMSTRHLEYSNHLKSGQYCWAAFGYHHVKNEPRSVRIETVLGPKPAPLTVEQANAAKKWITNDDVDFYSAHEADFFGEL
eukprot:COSAG02_NODE_834_length_16653_cov_9.111977_13_plen_527_part_00